MKAKAKALYAKGTLVISLKHSNVYWNVLDSFIIKSSDGSGRCLIRYKCEARIDGKLVRKGFNEDSLKLSSVSKFCGRYILAIIIRRLYHLLIRWHEKVGNWIYSGNFGHLVDKVAKPYPYDLYGVIED